MRLREPSMTDLTLPPSGHQPTIGSGDASVSMCGMRFLAAVLRICSSIASRSLTSSMFSGDKNVALFMSISS